MPASHARVRQGEGLSGLFVATPGLSPSPKPEHVVSTIDLQSVGQIDALRRVLGLAPGVDPIGTCRSLGVTKDPNSKDKNCGESGTSEDGENRKSESKGAEK